jgi:hypothetical protein
LLLTFGTLKLKHLVVTIKFINVNSILRLTENKVFWQLNFIKTKMKTKNLMVSFVAVALALFLAATVSASDYSVSDVTVDGVSAMYGSPAIIAGETVTVKVYFTSDVNASDITVEAEIECDKEDVQDETPSFDVEDGQDYKKVLSLEVPFDLKDEVSDDVLLNIKISGDGTDKYDDEFVLRVQRQSYDVSIKSVGVSSSVDAGETLPVDIVLKNLGYNNLDDVYVKVSIPELGVEKTAYFGDLVSLECPGDCDDCCNDNDVDTVYGRLYLAVPYSAKAGTYALDVDVSNDDTSSSKVKQIVINNDLPDSLIVGTYSQTVAVGEEAEYSVMIVNPTNKLKVYRLVTESANGISSGAQDTIVAIPAGSSRTETITAKATSEGKYTFNVNVFSGEELVETVTLTLNAEGETSGVTTNSVVILTVALAIVFLVLLVVLIVLVTKKPAKSEEFGESYY